MLYNKDRITLSFEFFTVNTKLAEMAVLALKRFNKSKKKVASRGMST